MTDTESWPGRNPRSGAGYVYLLRFDSGVVKVGQTRDPRRRARNLAADAARFGLSVADAWLSPPCIGYEAGEARLLRIAAALGERLAPEYFRCDWTLLVKAAERLELDDEPVRRLATPASRRIAERRREVRRLRDEGLVMQAIAGRLGISLGTVHADLSHSSE